MEELGKEREKTGFWENKEKAKEITQKISDLEAEIGKIDELKQELATFKELAALSKGDEVFLKEIEERIAGFEKQVKREEFKIFLSGRYDKGNGVLSIFAGAGGQDAQDWVAMLLRMYERYCNFKGFRTEIIEQTFGEGVGPEGRIGLKSATMEIEGSFAYGFLKKETGVHRLVRISPFSAKSLRHTSFALVEVIPHIPKFEKDKIKIKPEDLKMDFYRASGPGGQYVNKKETAVRITHLPTGILASCQSERSQLHNREKAMELLYGRLYKFYQEAHEEELSKIKAKKISPSWGNQIRSYVLNPYKLVKDLRTDLETHQVEKILDGELDEFIEAEIKI